MVARIVVLLLLLVAVAESAGQRNYGHRADRQPISDHAIGEVIAELGEIVAKSQITKPTAYDFPFSFEKQFGVYPGKIRGNLIGGPEMTLLRHLLGVFDNNAFVTLWVTAILLETAKFPGGPTPSDEQLYRALDAISVYHDKNYPLEDGIMIFWPETYNASAGLWHCGPVNLGPLARDEVKVFDVLHKVLDDLGLESLWDKIPFLLRTMNEMMDAFGIPADFDDTAVNLGLGSLLQYYSSTSREPFQRWWSNNTNFLQALEALKLYAYRPLSNNNDTNTIDPRTFFYMRDYLYQIKKEDHPAAFVPTWIHNITAGIHNTLVKHVNYKMPFYVNNIDLTVSTNVIYGLTSAVLAGLGNTTEWFDADLQMIYENTTDLIAWSISRNFSDRPDLALTYYPSVYNFYWFTARTLNLLASEESLPFPVLGRVRAQLSSVMRGSATDSILKAVTWDGNYAYIDDFLGDGDTDLFGKPVSHGDDRICTTAMVVNALLYIWTEKGQLVPETPYEVRRVVVGAAEWLVENTLTGKYKPYNAVFSGSVKAQEQIPFAFPANIAQYLNGSAVPPGGEITDDVMIGMRGIMSEEEYNKQLQLKHFGFHTPLDFHGFNTLSMFPFWSSEPFTYASTMLALTQYRTLFPS